MKQSFVQSEDFKGWSRITFYHPKGNSLPKELLEQLTAEVEGAYVKDINVLHICSEGKHFCAGASFDEFLSIEDYNEAVDFFSGFANLINAIQQSPFIVLISAQGSAVGGGVGLLSSGDLNIGSSAARAKLSEISIGIGPFAIQPALENRMSNQWVNMSLNPKKWFDSNELLQFGLIDEVVHEKDFEVLVTERINEIILYSSAALKAIKSAKVKVDLSKMLKGAEVSAHLLLQNEAQSFLNTLRNSN